MNGYICVYNHRKSRIIYMQVWQWLSLSIGILHKFFFPLNAFRSLQAFCTKYHIVRGMLAAVTSNSPNGMYWCNRNFSLMNQFNVGVPDWQAAFVSIVIQGPELLASCDFPYPALVNHGWFYTAPYPLPQDIWQCLQIFGVITTQERWGGCAPGV